MVWRALPNPIFVLDADGVVRQANDAARRFADGREVVGLPFADAVPSVASEALLEHVAEARRTERSAHLTLRQDDTADEVQVSLAALDGGVVLEIHEGSALGHLPVDEAARVSRGLVEAGIALSSALSLEHVLQVLCDVTRELIDAKYAALGVINPERTGLEEFVTSGLTAEQRARMAHAPHGHGILGLLIRDARPLRLRDLTEHPASAGIPAHHPVMHSFIGTPVMSRGRVFGNLYVTEKRSAPEFSEADLALLRTLAAQAAVAIENAELRRDRERFFAAASHELGNAVTGARMWARVLVNDPPTRLEEWQDGVRKILGATEHAGRLIEDLLSLSRLSAGRLSLAALSTDLVAIASDVADYFRAEAEASQLSIVLDAPDELPVETDPIRVRQIVLNLVANAAKFTPAGGTIELRVVADTDGGARIEVRDDGPGIAASDIERIFRPYEQVQSVARGRGAGLGLSLSRQLAVALGGELGVRSAPGEGATFTLRLPATHEPGRQGATTPPGGYGDVRMDGGVREPDGRT